MLAGALAALLIVAPTLAADPPHEHRDSDQDGLSDRLERRTGTDPMARDTDRDGVADGVEDRNRDGVVDAGESDPRVPGLFPGSVPHIPEPMVFDLVRGLGARAGELEVNNLALVPFDGKPWRWAPELEWAFADGYAVELELPMHGRSLDAIKVALQGTLPSPLRSFTHGLQVFGEVSVAGPSGDLVAVHIVGGRMGRASMLALIGGKLSFEGEDVVDGAGLANGSVFVDVREWLTYGVEVSVSLPRQEDASVRLTPQVHVQLHERFRVQYGPSLEITEQGRVSAAMGTRFILE